MADRKASWRMFSGGQIFLRRRISLSVLSHHPRWCHISQSAAFSRCQWAAGLSPEEGDPCHSPHRLSQPTTGPHNQPQEPIAHHSPPQSPAAHQRTTTGTHCPLRHHDKTVGWCTSALHTWGIPVWEDLEKDLLSLVSECSLWRLEYFWIIASELTTFFFSFFFFKRSYNDIMHLRFYHIKYCCLHIFSS